MSRLTIILATTVLVVAGGIVVTVSRLPFRILSGDSSRAVSNTEQDLRCIGLAILWLCELEKIELAPSARSLVKLDGSELYSSMSRSADAMRLARPSDRSRSQAAFTDSWGNSIHAEVSFRQRGMTVRMWSNGPNEVNELGHGDDIVEIVNVKVPGKVTGSEL